MKKVVAILFIMLFSLTVYAGEILLSGNTFVPECPVDGGMSISDNSLFWTWYGGAAESAFYVEESGEYNIAINYIPGKGRYDDIELYFSVDGILVPSFFSINRIYEYGPLREDEKGDARRALSWISDSEQRELLRNKNNSDSSYYSIYLSEGEHKLRVEGRRTDFELVSIQFVPVAALCDDVDNESGPDSVVHVEAENIYFTSSTVLTSQMDRSSADTSPSDPYHLLLNIAGGSNWNSDGDVMSWKFSIEEEGWYTLNFKFRQNFRKGFSVYRRVLIDGVVPSVSFDEIPFGYTDSWLVNNVGAAQVYLEEGEHVLSMEVVPGPYSSILTNILSTVDELNSIYRKIIMVTGTNPDINREYDLDREISGLMNDFSSVLERLESCSRELQNLDAGAGISYSQISTLASQIRSFLEDPESIPSRLSVFKSNISSLSSWVYQCQEQPLDLDWIEIAGNPSLVTESNAGFFSNLKYSTLSLIHSFKADKSEDKDITVWVSAGRDQMQVVSDLVDEYFTPESGIEVNINLVQTGVEQAVLAGSGPDVILFMGSNVPVTLAMREALYRLDSFPDFYEVFDSYADDREALVPYTYEGGVYGIPLTETFPVMFYRTDVFDELGIEPPDTWEELLAVIPVIQRKNMEVGIPSAYTTFLTILFQKGGRLYSEDLKKTALDTEQGNEAFLLYTRLFSDYALPLSYDFFNRFRSGEMPLAIVDYPEYGRLSFAAPELQGLWAMAAIPSTEGDSSIAVSSGQGAVILADTDNTEDSWAFLKWFVSIDMQTEYGNRIESLLGPAGRYASVSSSVIRNLPWLPEEAEMITGSRNNLVQIEQIPGSYYTQRNITSAFRNVVLKGANPREMLERYASIIDREIARKRNELGLEVLDE